MNKGISKNLTKAVILGLSLNFSISSDVSALTITDKTITLKDLYLDERFSKDLLEEGVITSGTGDKLILNNVVLNTTTEWKDITLLGVYKINGGNFNQNTNYDKNIIGGLGDNNKLIISNYIIENDYTDSDHLLTVSAGLSDSEKKSVSGNKIFIDNSKLGVVFGGNCDPSSYSGDSVNNNFVYLDHVEAHSVYGGYIAKEAKENGIVITNCKIHNALIAGVGEKIAENNYIIVKGYNDLSTAALAGCLPVGGKNENNTLTLNSFNSSIAALQFFDVIKFEKLDFDKEKVTITQGSIGLEDCKIKISSFASGQNFEIGKTFDLLKIEDKDSWDESFTNLNKQTTTNAGVAQVITSYIAKDDANQTITATIKGVELADQTMLVAENRAVAAAFVNQGTDLIADSLDVLSRDGKYGVKTFAAVQGNRSKYDVNSDIKINGWSTIVGVGSETEHNGGDFSWGLFYENGSGNYRTFNEFNNEFFRGDGSLVYNGGGIAARYENAHGVYTEGSLRAGMLKSDMDNALSDGENKYGYSSESEYYGAHIGIGQIIPLSESSDLDVYGKFFHTYTEGDSFKVDTDEFEFDSINSDRLRVGARLTTNKENKFSTYYGLAYEYEFNGDAEMRAAGMSAPTQSLQGSSCMAEVGFNYQPTPDSPWSFDLNMRGYAGERQGGSFNVQATYTF